MIVIWRASISHMSLSTALLAKPHRVRWKLVSAVAKPNTSLRVAMLSIFRTITSSTARCAASFFASRMARVAAVVSSATRTSINWSMRSGETGVRRMPLYGSLITMPWLPRTRSASRTGTRLTPSCSASSASMMRSPGRIKPLDAPATSASMTWCTSVRGCSFRKVRGAPAATGSTRCNAFAFTFPI